MGLFSNKKKRCPVCGEPTPRIFATKVDDQPICSGCDKKISMEEYKKDELSLYELERHLTYRASNEAAHESFNSSVQLYIFGGSISGSELHIDEEQRLWYINQDEENPPIFSLDSIERISYLEDENVVITATQEGTEKFDSVADWITLRHGVEDLSKSVTDFLFGEKQDEHIYPFKFFGFEITIKDDPYWNSLKVIFNAPYYREGQVTNYSIPYYESRGKAEDAMKELVRVLGW